MGCVAGSPPPSSGGTVSAPIGLLERAQTLAGRCDRPDLQRRLVLTRERLARPAVRVVVAGQAGKGKSSLVNALVAAPVCGVAGDTVPIGPSGISTLVPTVVRSGPAPAAALVHARPGAERSSGDAGAERTPVPVGSLVAEVVRAAGESPGRLLRAEVELPRKWLSGGLELVDTPGVGGMRVAATLSTVDLLPTAA